MAVLVMDEAVREKLTNRSDHSSYIYHNTVIGQFVTFTGCGQSLIANALQQLTN